MFSFVRERSVGAVNTVTGLQSKQFLKHHHRCWLSWCLSEVKYTIKGKARGKCENITFLKRFGLNPEFFYKEHRIKAKEGAAEKQQVQTNEQHLCMSGVLTAAQAVSPCLFCWSVYSLQRKSALGRLSNSGSCNPIWAHSYSSLVSEISYLNF